MANRGVFTGAGFQYQCTACGKLFLHPTRLTNGRLCPTDRANRARKGHTAMVRAHGYARIPKSPASRASVR